MEYQDKRVNKDISELNNTVHKIDLTDIYRVFHPTAAEHIFFSAADGTSPQ
jgi:hypothetical protein